MLPKAPGPPAGGLFRKTVTAWSCRCRPFLVEKAMEHRIEPLIRDRAPWLFSGRPGTAMARALLYRLLGYDSTIALARAIEHRTTPDILAQMGPMPSEAAWKAKVGGEEGLSVPHPLSLPSIGFRV